MNKENLIRLVAASCIALLLASGISLPVSAQGIPVAAGKEIWEFATEDNAEFARIIAYMYLMRAFVQGVVDDIKTNIATYLTTNPKTLESDFWNASEFFRNNVLILYVFAVAATALYMIYASNTPKDRAQAKYMLGKLVLGFLIVAISPYILHVFFSMSAATTDVIISETDVNSSLAPFEKLLMTSVSASELIVYPQMAVEWFGIHKGLHGKLHHMDIKGPLLQSLNKFKMAPKPDFTFPFLMIQMFFVFLLYGLLGLRYIMVMTWALLFPVTIFLSTFEPTKGLGKNLLEQTVFWTILQVFYALSLAVMGAGMQMLPSGFDYYKLGLSLFFVDLTLSFFSIGACIVLLLTPIFVLSMVQRLMSL